MRSVLKTIVEIRALLNLPLHKRGERLRNPDNKRAKQVGSLGSRLKKESN